MHSVAPRLRGPWPLRSDLAAAELAAYLVAAADPAIQHLPTRCPPWTVHDLTAHLALTFRRFADLLERSRPGDLTPPFARDELAAENLRAVAAFRGDPLAELARQARRFLDLAGDPEEVMAHQFGPIPVGLQVAFGLNELAIHHDDLAAACGHRYRPPAPVIDALAPMWEQVLGGLPAGDDNWDRILAASGREGVG